MRPGDMVVPRDIAVEPLSDIIDRDTDAKMFKTIKRVGEVKCATPCLVIETRFDKDGGSWYRILFPGGIGWVRGHWVDKIRL